MSCLGETPLSHTSDSASQPSPLVGPGIPTREDWEEYRDFISGLYRDTDLSLKQIQARLRDRFNFNATEPKLKRRLARWNVSRNIREQDLPDVLQGITEALQTGAKTVQINDRPHDVASLVRNLRRRGSRHSDALACISPPAPWIGSGLPSPPSSVRNAPDSQTYAVFEREDGPMLSSQGSASPGQLGITSPNTDAVEERVSRPCEQVNQELDAACVATLQTDYHLVEIDRAPKQDSNSPVDESPLEHKIRGYLIVMHRLSDPQELRELHQVVLETDVYYQWMQNERENSVLRPFECSANEEGRARDFYGRYWIGLLHSVGDSPMFGNAMLEQAFDQVRASIDEHHPHFLTWICFVICYEGCGIQNGPIDSRVANRALTFAYETSKASMEETDPRLNIQKVLNASTRRRDLALSLLRQVVDKFRAETSAADLDTTQRLGQLFDQIEPSNGQQIEEILQGWANNSRGLAQVIHAERRLRCRL